MLVVVVTATQLPPPEHLQAPGTGLRAPVNPHSNPKWTLLFIIPRFTGEEMEVHTRLAACW